MKFEKPLNYVTEPNDSDFAFMQEIDWFSNCGREPTAISLENAVAAINSDEWENFQLDRRGDTTVFLLKNRRNEYSEWNTLTDGLKAFLEEQVFPKVMLSIADHGLSESIYPSVQWDLLSFMQEEAYSSLGIPRFYDKIMESYRNGRLPYGWDDEYPEGDLLAY